MVDAPTVTLFGVVLTTMMTTLGAVWSLALWLTKQFSLIRHLVYDKINENTAAIIEKIEYHEKHDDQRFEQVRRDIWDLRLQTAAREGRLPRLRPNAEEENRTDQ